MPHPSEAPRRLTLERGASLFALVALAIAQPVLDVIANSPEFFVARDTAPWRAVAAVGAICVGLPLLLLAIEVTVRRLSFRAGTAIHGVLLSVLIAALAMPLVKASIPGWPWDGIGGVAVGLAGAVGYFRARAARLFLTILAPAALVVPAVFFVSADVRRGLLPPTASAHPEAMARTPPIVFVVFDELPLNSLLNARREIDTEWYPNFAALARDGYWFRNAGTVSSQTVWAVPALVSGRYPMTPHSLPNLRYYPDNLFTLLAGRYDITAFMPFRQLCPAGVCRGDTTVLDTVPGLLADFGLLWLHVVLPERFAGGLPPVNENWMGFAQAAERGPGRRAANFRAAEFDRFVRSIEGRPAQLHYLHTLLPHWPLQYAATGRRYPGPSYSSRKEGGRRLFLETSAEYADALHQRHLAQVRFADRLLGDLVARLRHLNAYETTLLIITADHGSSYREGTERRIEGRNNSWDIIHVPLFLKLPGQRQGATVDRIAESVDVLPTVIDLLSLETGIDLDGRSLLDERLPARTTRTFIQRGRARAVRRDLDDLTAASRVSLERKIARFGNGDPHTLYAPPDTRHLLGRAGPDLPVRAGALPEIAIDDAHRFQQVDLSTDLLPLHVGGSIRGTSTAPLTLAVVLNGTVAAVTRSFRRQGEHVFGTLVPEDLFREGSNQIGVVVLDEGRLSAR